MKFRTSTSSVWLNTRAEAMFDAPTLEALLGESSLTRSYPKKAPR